MLTAVCPSCVPCSLARWCCCPFVCLTILNRVACCLAAGHRRVLHQQSLVTHLLSPPPNCTSFSSAACPVLHAYPSSAAVALYGGAYHTGRFHAVVVLCSFVRAVLTTAAPPSTPSCCPSTPNTGHDLIAVLHSAMRSRFPHGCVRSAPRPRAKLQVALASWVLLHATFGDR